LLSFHPQTGDKVGVYCQKYVILFIKNKIDLLSPVTRWCQNLQFRNSLFKRRRSTLPNVAGHTSSLCRIENGAGLTALHRFRARHADDVLLAVVREGDDIEVDVATQIAGLLAAVELKNCFRVLELRARRICY
jgi:hypothetical protein